MKLIHVVLLLLVFLLLTACSANPNTDPTDLTVSSQEAVPLIPEQEYHEIGEQFVGGNWINESPSVFGIPEDNIFVTDSELVSYDYVSFFGTEGNVALYLQDEKIAKCVFGSNPFDDRTVFSEALNLVNNSVAETLGTEVKEMVFIGHDDSEDEWELFYNGGGSFASEYAVNGIFVSVRGIGINSMATVVVECHPTD